MAEPWCAELTNLVFGAWFELSRWRFYSEILRNNQSKHGDYKVWWAAMFDEKCSFLLNDFISSKLFCWKLEIDWGHAPCTCFLSPESDSFTHYVPFLRTFLFLSTVNFLITRQFESWRRDYLPNRCVKTKASDVFWSRRFNAYKRSTKTVKKLFSFTWISISSIALETT